MIKLRNFKLKYRFSDVELQHLAIGTLLVSAVLASLFIDRLTTNPLFVLGIAIVTAPLFFLHEIGHKISAQHYNMWSEFRLDQGGALITALSIIMPFKLVAPGAVQSVARSYDDMDKLGKISAYGPTMNIYLGGLYLIITGISYIFGSFISISFFLIYEIFFWASGFSFFLAIFNMLPFGPLDGNKVKHWNNSAFWLFFGICGIFALETFVYPMMLGGGYYLGGNILEGVFITFGLTGDFYSVLIRMYYPVIIGFIAFFIGRNLIKNLQDPNWEPGRPRGYDEYVTDYTQTYYQSRPNVTTRNAPSENTPMNQPCAECGKKELLPFRCSTCNKLYCAEHRLAGRHFCIIDA